MSQASRDILLLDGATGTELGRHGADISLPLWSARALIDKPDLVRDVHADYVRAGADIITANTFRTHRRSLAKAGMGDRAKELTALAVRLAREACDQVRPDAMVFGSVAPLEDCYTPSLSPPREACRAEHAEIIAHLLDAGVDGILMETHNTLHEVVAAADAARELVRPPVKWCVSCCLKSQGPPGLLLSGEPMTDVLPALTGAFAVGGIL